jgi:hypothetical protein
MKRVYEKAHREVKMSQYVESNAMNKHMENHLYLNHSKQKIEIIKAHILLPKVKDRRRRPEGGWMGAN